MAPDGLPVQTILADPGLGVRIDRGAGSAMRSVGKILASGTRNYRSRGTVQVGLSTRRIKFFALSKGLSPQEL